jgi:hypothetical protein
MKVKMIDGIYDSDVYFEIFGEKMRNEYVRDIRGYVSEFKTYCIINKKPYNIPHFINWMNKYTDFRVSFGLKTEARIDF